MMSANDKSKDPLDYMSPEEWSRMGEELEPEIESAHQPKLKTEVLTIRLGAADMRRLKDLAGRMGVGHSTLARVILRRALHDGGAGIEEAAVTSEHR